MDKHGIYKFSKLDYVLNNPGQFYFQITEDDGIKYSNNIAIQKKFVDLIKNNIQEVFKHISENLKTCLNINYEYYTSIISKLDRYCSSNNSFKFPGLQVINLNNQHIEFFSKIPERILICEKSDGVRYLLIHFSNDKVLFLGRNLEFFIVDLTIQLPHSNSSRTAFNGKKEWEIENLLDGELILDKIDDKEKARILNSEIIVNKNFVFINDDLYEIKFLVFDALILCEKNIGYLKFYQRLQHLTDYFQKIKFQTFMLDAKKKFYSKFNNSIDTSIKHNINEYNISNQINQKNTKFSIELFMKDYYTFDKIDFLYNKVSKFLHHANDGIIINLDDYPYYTGQASEIYKWKPAQLNTIDFELTTIKLSDKRLFVLNVKESRDKLIPIACLFMHNKEEEKLFLEEYNEIRNSPNRVIAECFYDLTFNTEETTNYHLQWSYGIIKKLDIVTKKECLNLNNYNFRFIDEKRSEGVNLKHHEIGSWRFLRFRKDKQQSNHVSTFLSVWNAIKENVTLEYIVNKIKSNATNRENFDSNVVLAKNLESFMKSKPIENFQYFEPSQITTTQIPQNPKIISQRDNEFLNKKRLPVVDSISFQKENKVLPKKIFMEEKNTISSTPNIITPPTVSKKEVKLKKENEKKQKFLTQAKQSLDLAFDSKPKDVYKIDQETENKNNHNVQNNFLLNNDEENYSLDDSSSD